MDKLPTSQQKAQYVQDKGDLAVEVVNGYQNRDGDHHLGQEHNPSGNGVGNAHSPPHHVDDRARCPASTDPKRGFLLECKLMNDIQMN